MSRESLSPDFLLETWTSSPLKIGCFWPILKWNLQGRGSVIRRATMKLVLFSFNSKSQDFQAPSCIQPKKTFISFIFAISFLTVGEECPSKCDSWHRFSFVNAVFSLSISDVLGAKDSVPTHTVWRDISVPSAATSDWCCESYRHFLPFVEFFSLDGFHKARLPPLIASGQEIPGQQGSLSNMAASRLPEEAYSLV